MTRQNVGRLIDNIGALILRQATTWTLTFVLILYLPRHLGDTSFGMVTFATALVTMLLVVTNLGVGTYLVKRIAVSQEEWSDLFWNALLLRVGGGLLVAAVMLPVANFATHGDLRALLFLTVATLAVLSLAKTAEYAMQGLEKMRWLAVAEIANKAIVATVGVTLLLSGYGVVTFGAVVFLGALAQLIVNLGALSAYGLERPRFRLKQLRILFFGGMPFLMASAITQVYGTMDVTMLQLMAAQQVVGWYGAALQLYTTLNFFPMVLTMALLPVMTRFYAARDEVAFRSLASRGLALALLTALPIGIGLALMSGEVINLLGYPDVFSKSVPVLVILSLTLPISGALMMLNMVVIAMDRQAEWVKLIAVSLVVGVVLNVVLILVFDRLYGNGGVGAAVATLLAEAFQMTLALRLMPAGMLNRRLGIQVAQSLAAAGAMAAVVVAGHQYLDLPYYAMVPAGAATYAATLLMLGGFRLADLAGLRGAWVFSRSNASSHDLYERTPAGVLSE